MPEWINSFSQVLCLGWGFLLHKIHFPVGYFLACILAVVMCHWECNCISVTPLIMPLETPVLLRSHIAIKNYKEFPERSIWSGPICNNVACLHRGRHGLWAPGKATLSLTLTFNTKTCQWLWFGLDVKIKFSKVKKPGQNYHGPTFLDCNLKKFSDKIAKSFSVSLTLGKLWGYWRVTTGFIGAYCN